MSESLSRRLETLTRVDGVQGAMVVDVEAGVPVSSHLATGVEETALAALTGALFTRTDDASASGGYGALRVLQLEAADGHVVVAGAGALAVVVLTDATARLGLVRVRAERAAEELRE